VCGRRSPAFPFNPKTKPTFFFACNPTPLYICTTYPALFFSPSRLSTWCITAGNNCRVLYDRVRFLLLPGTIERSQSSLAPTSRMKPLRPFLLKGHIFIEQINERISDCGQAFRIRSIHHHCSIKPASSKNI